MIRYTHRLPFVQKIRLALLERAAGLDHDCATECSQLCHEQEDVGRDPPDDETSLALLALGQSELEQVNHALDLIDLGTYGTCEGCGRDIPNERLLAMPLATRCVGCQRAEEKN